VQSQQSVLAQSRGANGVAGLPGDSLHLVYEPNDPPGKLVGIAVFVGGEPLPQVPGLTDVKDPVAFVGHDVNARRARDAAEKGLIENAEERPGMIEKLELARRHAQLFTVVAGVAS